jgi:hypothetical protein
MFAPAVGQSTLPFCLTYIHLPHVTLTRLSVEFLIGGHLELLAHVSFKARGQGARARLPI